MFIKKVRSFVAALLVLLALAGMAPQNTLAANVVKVKVTTSSAYIYKKASTTSSKLKKLSKDTVLTCGATNGNWAYVRYDGVTGYMLKSVLALSTPAVTPTPAPTAAPTEEPASSEPPVAPAETEQPAATSTPSPTPAPTTAAGVAAITTANLKLYKTPSTASSCYGTIPKGKTVTCIKISGSWAHIQYSKYDGYSLVSGLKAASSAATSSPSSTTSSGIICYIKADANLLRTASANAEAVDTLKMGDKVLVTHVKSNWARVITTNSTVGYLPSSYISKNKVAAVGEVILADWWTSDIQNIFSRGCVATVTDVGTRKSFQIHRKGGINHADCEPLTLADTKIMLEIYGGKWSWDRHAIWLTIGNSTYAASMNGMAHGEEAILSNDFDGIFCVHFYNSRTSATNKVDPDHQAAIKIAYQTKP